MGLNVALLKEVKRRVLAEPERVDMKYWVKQHKVLFWPCGSTCCIAGHAIEASGGDPDQLHELKDPLAYAAALVGLNLLEAGRLFWLHKLHEHPPGTPYADLSLRLTGCKPRTSEYAAIVAEAIDRCIALNGKPIEEPTEQQIAEVLASIEE